MRPSLRRKRTRSACASKPLGVGGGSGRAEAAAAGRGASRGSRCSGRAPGLHLSPPRPMPPCWRLIGPRRQRAAPPKPRRLGTNNDFNHDALVLGAEQTIPGHLIPDSSLTGLNLVPPPPQKKMLILTGELLWPRKTQLIGEAQRVLCKPTEPGAVKETELLEKGR